MRGESRNGRVFSKLSFHPAAELDITGIAGVCVAANEASAAALADRLAGFPATMNLAAPVLRSTSEV